MLKSKANWKDPSWKYNNAAESAKTGYLEKRMKMYMEMVKNESQPKQVVQLKKVAK